VSTRYSTSSPEAELPIVPGSVPSSSWPPTPVEQHPILEPTLYFDTHSTGTVNSPQFDYNYYNFSGPSDSPYPSSTDYGSSVSEYGYHPIGAFRPPPVPAAPDANTVPRRRSSSCPPINASLATYFTSYDHQLYDEQPQYHGEASVLAQTTMGQSQIEPHLVHSVDDELLERRPSMFRLVMNDCWIGVPSSAPALVHDGLGADANPVERRASVLRLEGYQRMVNGLAPTLDDLQWPEADALPEVAALELAFPRLEFTNPFVPMPPHAVHAANEAIDHGTFNFDTTLPAWNDVMSDPLMDYFNFDAPIAMSQ
jgi:hypothetical protein